MTRPKQLHSLWITSSKQLWLVNIKPKPQRLKKLSLKISEAFDRKLATAVRRRGMQKSAVVRQALEQYLDNSSEIRCGSLLALAGDLVGCVKDAPAGLSTSPRHLADFGG